MTGPGTKNGAASAARRQRVNAIVDAAARLSHDLGNQLTVLLGVLDFARNEAPPGATAQRIGEAQRAAQRIAKLVHAMQRLGAPRHTERRPVDLVATVQRVLQRFDGWLPAGVTLRLASGPDALGVVTDAALVDAALVHVLVNAARAVDMQGTIEVSVETDDERWRITVQDDGPGVPADLVERVFDPLVTTRRMPGAGLGLSTALLSMAAIDGDVLLSSDNGTRVTLTAPLERAPGPVAAPPPAVLVRGRGSVLVVDDSPVTLMEAHAILAGAGYEVALARGHERALDQLTSGTRADLILAETVLYDGGAAELLDWLRQREQATPVIGTVFRGEPAPPDAEQFASVVTKPFDAHSLSAEVAERLNSR